MTQNPIYILNAHIKISIFIKNLTQTFRIPKFKPILRFLAIQRFLDRVRVGVGALIRVRVSPRIIISVRALI